MSTVNSPAARQMESVSFLAIKMAQAAGKYIAVGDLSSVLLELAEQPAGPLGDLAIRFRTVDGEVGSPDVSRAIDTLVKSDQVEITYSGSLSIVPSFRQSALRKRVSR